MPGDGGFPDAFGVDTAGGGVPGDLLRRFCDLGAATVVHAIVHGDHIVVEGHLLGDVEFLDDTAPHPCPGTDPAHPHTHHVEVLPPSAHHFAVETHQESDLVGAALPVLGGERVNRKVFDSQFDCAAGDVDEDRLTHFVAFGAAQAAAGCPPSVAVHDDGHVPGKLVGGDRRRDRLGDVLGRPSRTAIGRRGQFGEYHRPGRSVREYRVVLGRRRQLRKPLPAPALSPPPGAGHPVHRHVPHPA